MDVHHGPEPSIQRLMTTLQAVAALHKCCEMYDQFCTDPDVSISW